MKNNAFLTLSLIAAVTTFVWQAQIPLGTALGNVAGQLAAASGGGKSYGERLGQTVHDVVLNIRAQDKQRGHKSYITHAHVMAIMCQENPKLSINLTNGEGRKEGLTQVITSTWKGLVHGRGAGGQCRYIAKLEKGACGDIRSRTANPRCSIETGACLYNYELKKNRGNATRAYNAYNTGKSYKRANGLSSFVRAYNASSRGYLCAKSRANFSVWRAMRQKISQLTGGKFKTDDAQHITASSAGWPNDPSKYPSVSNIGNNFWNTPTGQSLSKAMGGAPQASPQSGGQGGESPIDNPYSRAGNQSKLGRSRAAALEQALQENGGLRSPDAKLTCTNEARGVRLAWSCPRGTTVSRGSITGQGSRVSRFDTRGAGAGAITVDAEGDAEYTVECLKGINVYAEATCKVKSPEVASRDTESEDGFLDDSAADSTTEIIRDSIPRGVVMRVVFEQRRTQRGIQSAVLWATLGATSCSISVNGQNIAEGIRGGKAVATPQRNTLIKLECDTQKGKAIKYKRLIIQNK